MKNYKMAWNVSLLTISFITIVMSISNVSESGLPDALTRVLGVVDLCAVVVLVYTSVKMKIWKNWRKKQ